MSVLCGTQRSEPVIATACRTASSRDSHGIGADAIACRVASRITHVPSGAQYSEETFLTRITLAHLRMDVRYSQTARRAE